MFLDRSDFQILMGRRIHVYSGSGLWFSGLLKQNRRSRYKVWLATRLCQPAK